MWECKSDSIPKKMRLVLSPFASVFRHFLSLQSTVECVTEKKVPVCIHIVMADESTLQHLLIRNISKTNYRSVNCMRSDHYRYIRHANAIYVNYFQSSISLHLSNQFILNFRRIYQNRRYYTYNS